MKKIVIILLIVVAILAIVPRFIGATVEDNIRDLYQKANQHSSWSFEVVDYKRGWFSSTLKVNVGLAINPAALTKDPLKLSITHDLQHGPVLWKVGGLGFGLVDTVHGVELPEAARAELVEYKQAMSATSRIGFDGSSSSILKINPLSVSKNGVDVEILAGEFKADLDTSAHIGLNGDWKGMTIKNLDGADAEIFDLGVKMNQTSITGKIFGLDALFEGDMSLTLKSVKTLDGSEGLSVENISLTSTSKFSGDVADFNMFFGFAKMSVAGQDFTDAVYDVSFENVSKDALLEIQKVFSGDNVGIDPTLALQNLQGVLPKLFEKGPILKINSLGVKTEAGEINTSATISIDKGKYDPDNMMSLIMAADAVASGFAPEAFFSNLGLSSDIEMMIQQNFLVKDGDQLKFDASFKNGEATLNGTPMPLGM